MNTATLPLFDWKPPFSGQTFDPALDQARLDGQITRVRNLMRDGKWRTLEEISDATGDKSVASISARLRDLRKERFGGHEVLRRRRGEAERGLFEYCVIVKGEGE